MMSAAAPSLLPPAPLWDWRDKTSCAIGAPHWMILTAAECGFLWRLARRADAGRSPFPGNIARLDRIIERLEQYALDNGISWP